MRREIITARIHQNSDWRDWQEAADATAFRRLGIHHIHQLQQDGTHWQCFVFQQRHRASAHPFTHQQINATLHHGVFPTDEVHIFTRQCGVTIKSNGGAFIREARIAWHHHVFSRSDHQRILATIFLMQTNRIKQAQSKRHQIGIAIGFRDQLSNLLRFFATVRMHFQQAITPHFQL
ncbi:Uncharacterised protein [Vibrio cholerae]|nr:Uncharacterised protein [Vibrio cholerae]